MYPEAASARRFTLTPVAVSRALSESGLRPRWAAMNGKVRRSVSYGRAISAPHRSIRPDGAAGARSGRGQVGAVRPSSNACEAVAVCELICSTRRSQVASESG